MATAVDSTRTPAVQAPLLPLVPFVFRPAAPSADPRDPAELLKEIRRIIEACPDEEPRPELPIPPLLPVADHARAIHLRRQLVEAAEHGAALLASLGLPRLVEPGAIIVDPVAAGDALDLAIATLDALDGDTDLEPYLAGFYNGRVDPNGEPEADRDDEPWLGAPEGSQSYASGDRDLEPDGEIERPWWGPNADGWNQDGGRYV